LTEGGKSEDNSKTKQEKEKKKNNAGLKGQRKTQRRIENKKGEE